jgi:Mn2+/Fe2+ NRAMP family transporter
MFSPNRKTPMLPNDGGKAPKEPISKENKRRLWITAALTAVLFVIWFGGFAVAEVLQNPLIMYVLLTVYCVAFAVILVVYLAYNRAFVNKDVTEDMLPEEWSSEKKKAFVEGNRIRAEKSRWMMMLIIPFVVVFMVEALYLFVWDGYLSKLFGG